MQLALLDQTTSLGIGRQGNLRLLYNSEVVPCLAGSEGVHVGHRHLIVE